MAHLEVAKSALNDNLPQKCNFDLYEFFHDPSQENLGSSSTHNPTLPCPVILTLRWTGQLTSVVSVIALDFQSGLFVQRHSLGFKSFFVWVTSCLLA